MPKSAHLFARFSRRISYLWKSSKSKYFLKTCMFLHYCHCLQRDIYPSPTYSSHSRYVYQVRLLNQLVDNCKNAVNFQQLEKCQSCQFHYDKDFTTTMSYECLSHKFTLCLNCARLHRICPKDFSVATLDAVTSFVEKFKQNGLDQWMCESDEQLNLVNITVIII